MSWREFRASDADREQAVEQLQAHAADGRLDPDELEQRIGSAFAARTAGDVQALFRDLPAPPRTPAAPRDRTGFRVHLSVFVAVNVMLIAIWALSGMGYFWPVWPLMGWGIGLAAHAGALRPHGGRRAALGTRRPPGGALPGPSGAARRRSRRR